MWGEEEDFADHDYYNSIPGKEPPIGGVVDSRLRMSGAMPGHIHTQPQSKTAAQVSLHKNPPHPPTMPASQFSIIWHENLRHHRMLFEMELKLCLLTVTKWQGYLANQVIILDTSLLLW